MNLLLLHDTDINGEHARVEGRRAAHILKVLKKGPGDTLRAGILNRGPCSATITAVSVSGVSLRLSEHLPCPVPHIHIVLAVPRPKVLSRVIAAASSFGIASLTLVNAWRVEKSYFESPRLEPARMLEDALLGCEQGAQVWLPTLTIERSFRRYVEDVDPLALPREQAGRVVLHPTADATLGDLLPHSRGDAPHPLLLAIGPEGGFIDAELQSLEQAGYRPARLETGPLKTEVALAAALGQLALLRPSPRVIA